jgi:hypothetical protein
MTEEPLTVVLRRLWEDTLTIREADPAEVEVARLALLDQMEADAVARRAGLDQMEAASRDLDALAARLRRRLEGSDG